MVHVSRLRLRHSSLVVIEDFPASDGPRLPDVYPLEIWRGVAIGLGGCGNWPGGRSLARGVTLLLRDGVNSFWCRIVCDPVTAKPIIMGNQSDLAVAQYHMETHSIKSSLWTAPACSTVTAILVKRQRRGACTRYLEAPYHPRTA